MSRMKKIVVRDVVRAILVVICLGAIAHAAYVVCKDYIRL